MPQGCLWFVIVVFFDHTHLLFLHLSISNDIVSTKIYYKRGDFDFEIVNFPFLDGDVPRSTYYGVYISQLIRFARASSYVADFGLSPPVKVFLLTVPRLCFFCGSVLGDDALIS